MQLQSVHTTHEESLRKERAHHSSGMLCCCLVSTTLPIYVWTALAQLKTACDAELQRREEASRTAAASVVARVEEQSQVRLAAEHDMYSVAKASANEAGARLLSQADAHRKQLQQLQETAQEAAASVHASHVQQVQQLEASHEQRVLIAIPVLLFVPLPHVLMCPVYGMRVVSIS